MRLIDADAYQEELEDLYRVRIDWRNDTSDERRGLDAAMCALADAPTIDAVPVVRCRECVNYVESVEANGEKMCVKDADWCVEDGCYYGFTDYPAPDWFCADGERKDGDA